VHTSLSSLALRYLLLEEVSTNIMWSSSSTATDDGAAAAVKML
jgi:hypothetical protein